ncbi:hypothetical protein J2741_001820 [Methanolinea mesophila]|uniref:DUF4097 family beta strand repeat-containing protein n=1 Tax=Methanolinea mesophila TaxID=547055 RepID=UPI001AE0F37A|nr:DUF4097 family beta strand repeat-containing protein [Methanolinea mesophila]MBP1929273.1 hypothetical protein [Methanolinea mesophila]
MRGLFLLGLLGIGMVFFAGCTSPSIPGGGMVQEEFHGAYDLPPGATLEVHNLNGNIAISGSPDRTLVVDAVKSSLYGQGELDRATIEVQNGTESSVITRFSPPGARVSVSYRILVPTTVSVVKVDTTNGNIDASGVTGDGTVGSTNGYLYLSDWNGTVRGSTTNGRIVINNVGKIAFLHTTNGPISGTLGDMSGEPVLISTTNGAVSLRLEKDLTSPLSISSSNSPVTIVIPEIFNANVDLSTTNGQILFEGVTLSGVSGLGSHMTGVLGSGGPKLAVSTTNGNIILRSA